MSYRPWMCAGPKCIRQIDRRGQEAPMAIVIVTPIAALVSVAWYALLRK